MCGISAVIDRRGHPIDRRLVTDMNARVLHRGPDDEGIFEGPNFSLGHRRLSILDLSHAGHQPMGFRDRSVVTYNGEIYNYLELRTDLAKQGYEFSTTTDTEVLLAAYDYWGEDCLRRFNGMWAFVLWDRKRQVLFCSRDRFGVKPLHYVELGPLFAIGSEIKQFLALPGFSPVPDPISAYRFLVDGAIGVDDREFVSGVRSLRGGHNLRFDLASGRHTIQRWYDLDATTRPCRLSFDDASDRFRELLFDAVGIRLRSDVSVGVCLSGGVDSSSIASIAKRVTSSSSEIRSVSCVWDDPACDESRFIDEVVRANCLDAVISRPDMDDLLNGGALDRLVYHQDQPVLSASQFAEYAVFGAARAHGLVVMLDGQGADEYLAGYGWFFAPFIRSLLLSGKWGAALNEVGRRSALRGSPLHAGIRSLWNTLVSARLRDAVRGPQSGRELGGWAGPLLDELHGDPSARVARYHGANSMRELSLREILDTSMPQQLHSEDRNSMLHSIESRLPFMDYRLVEFGLSLPDDFKIRDGATKAVVRHGLRGILPDAIRNRHDKVGFPAPDEVWMRRNSSIVRKELSSAIDRFPQFVRPALLDRFDRMLIQGTPYDDTFFRVVALNRWARVFELSGQPGVRAGATSASSLV
jgi:asparagine synthase (glutamine-hydrolysing)